MRLKTGGVEFSFPARAEERVAAGSGRRFCRGCGVGIYTEPAVSFASKEDALAAEVKPERCILTGVADLLLDAGDGPCRMCASMRLR